ncbi:hypothetical protein [Mesorhizobium sp. CAU 1741]|uniref:hypothetical protein n=1 Tax=Mesorhizobium sp. CAU 1741 TaxID=3140366 RepID=UPI00325BAF19
MNNYRTRMLTAKDPRFAKIHDAIYGRRDLVAAAPEPVVDSTAELRAEYERIHGKRPYMGWDDAELRKRISEAKA